VLLKKTYLVKNIKRPQTAENLLFKKWSFTLEIIS
jgi:hypothetical protein